jgi:hypothetical protein
MKKAIVLLTTVFALLLASFAFVGGASADENAPHICIYSGLLARPGEIASINVLDVNGNSVFSYTLDNSGGSTDAFSDDYLAYIPAVSGTIYVNFTGGPFGDFSFSLPVNLAGNGECFNDGRLNRRPDRDLAAPVAIYVRFEEDGDGFTGYDIYDINQTTGTGLPVIRVTSDELNDAADEAVASGANVTVAQEGDILLTVLASSTDDTAICQVNAIEEREGKPYEYQWVCLE